MVNFYINYFYISLCFITFKSVDAADFFINPGNSKQRLYEALRKSFTENLPDKDICEEFGVKFNTFRSAKRDFSRMIKNGGDPSGLFFSPAKVGKRQKPIPEVEKQIVSLREQNLSVPDIRAVLSAQDRHVSLWKIDQVLKEHHFPALPRRTRQSKRQINLPEGFQPPESAPVKWDKIRSFESLHGSIFLFVPMLKQLGIEELIEASGYPQTRQLSRLNAVLSFLALKLSSSKRLAHSNDYGLDRGLGLFAGLNVLPKNAWFGSYSYRVGRSMNVKLLEGLNKKLGELLPGEEDFNLDFTTIPHWGDESVLERNWSSTRHVGLKSVLAMIVQRQGNKTLTYSNAEIKHEGQSDGILEFVDFYKRSGGTVNCLIFDSKFTTFKNLDALNRDDIKFLTLRRRSKKLVEMAEHAPGPEWKAVRLGKNFRRKHRNLHVHDSRASIKGYQGELRQIVVRNNGREQPVFIITNDFDITTKQAVLKYAQRWLVEQAIAEQIEFYHLNRLNSSIVVKVDFDLTMSLLADAVYKLFCAQISGFEKCKADKIYRSFIENYAYFKIEDKEIHIRLNKKVHLPLLFETDFFNKETPMPWLDNYKLKFEVATTS